MIPQEQLDNNFVYHAPNQEQLVKYNVLREMAKRFAEEINGLCSDSREKSLAMTNLEQSVMWANKAIACNE